MTFKPLPPAQARFAVNKPKNRCIAVRNCTVKKYYSSRAGQNVLSPRRQPFARQRLRKKSTRFHNLVYSDRMSDALVINEIYLSLQGESTFAGLPCIFIRLTACDLRCSYCDTAYAFTEGKKLTLEKILERVRQLAEPFSGKPNPSGAKLPL